VPSRRPRCHSLIAPVLLWALCAPARGEMMESKDVEDLLAAAARRDAPYRAPDGRDVVRAEELFLGLFRGERDGEGWRRLGFVLEDIGQGVAVREIEPQGRGLYVVRGDGGAVALEAPHHLSDRRTGTITARLLAEQPFAAAAFSTVPRKAGDLAHEPDSYFNAFTRAFAGAFPGARVVQLHGFDGEARDVDAEMILSATLRPAPAALEGYGRCLAAAGIRVARFPDEVRVLGGTTNSNARAFYGAGGQLFLHIEMTSELRDHLARSREARGRFAACLLGEAR